MSKIRIGLVGAGPWAEMVYAPTLSSSVDVSFSGVWARRAEAATELAAKFNTQGFADYEAMLEHCDAVAFAVPPDVQAEMAAIAARAGKAVLLEKPVGLTLADAESLVSEINAAGVISQVMLTWRYTNTVRSFIDTVRSADPLGARAHFVTGSCLSGPFATPWRRREGPLVDLGPHVFDTLDASLGPIVRVRAQGNSQRWIGVMLEHESGVCSDVSLCGHSKVSPERSGAEVYTHDGVIEISGVDGVSAISEGAFQRAVAEFASAVQTNTPHPLDVNRGLYLQRLVDTAQRDIANR